ncbi:MAG: peptidoglycan-associated lipoprotein Pal [Verrucomicrobia bacterium]|nr:peptidoglycan-associated lipoprotein Pal [Verrucomicrobiota bacterium]
MIPDPSFFASETVYFDFDRSLVKSGDKKKVENVATYLKSHREEKVLVEGHCDERGTEEYNRTLGEKRAQAVREALAKLGVSSDRIRTKSFGEDKPAVNGHDEAAWSKNRRGEFVLLRPKAGT